ncbi:accessory factor UbiK family protein [uncultured Propionivibrio sp.]|uniref:accessory factor UbiK family protein n=1 Tax=uncultured Propionivibrio sp. TaxID=426737 RepID=UPI0029C0201E|nr:accessory factor UbiK family protein [uncultured Propionivibrio sp.]
MNDSLNGVEHTNARQGRTSTWRAIQKIFYELYAYNKQQETALMNCTALAQFHRELAPRQCRRAPHSAVLDLRKNPDTEATMLDPKIFEELSAKLSAIAAATPAADIEKNVRALLSGFFSRLDLVTREEFDIQAQVLQRTREKLSALEERVARMENATPPDTNASR